MNSKPRLYALGAQFADAAALLRAAEAVRARGFKWWDVHSPFPVHGMDGAMGLGRSAVSLFSLLGGVAGFVLAFAMIYYTSEIDYPLVAHGKPYFALEPSVPIFFELTVLLTAFAALFGMLLLNWMPRWNHPVFNWEKFLQHGSDDGFFLVIEARDPRFCDEGTRKFLEKLSGTEITEIFYDA